MKKKAVIIIVAVLIVSVIAAGVVFGDEILLLTAHREIVDAYDDYPLQTKERGNYILVSTRQEADDGVVVYSFVIKDKNSEEIVFKCPGAWRSWDLKYIGFIDDGLDILVASGDVGNTCYSYADGEWTEIYNPEEIDYSQLREDKAVFISEDSSEYFSLISDTN